MPPRGRSRGNLSPPPGFRQTGLCWTWPEADAAVIGRFVNRPYEWGSACGSRGASRSARVGRGRKPKKAAGASPRPTSLPKQCCNGALCAPFFHPPVILNRVAVKNPVNRTPKPQNTGSFTTFRMTEYFLQAARVGRCRKPEHCQPGTRFPSWSVYTAGAMPETSRTISS